MDLMGVKEAAGYLGIAPVTVYRLSERGKLPARKVGGKWKFIRDELDRWLRERR
jgi:nitrogen PTS system EIIA component